MIWYVNRDPQSNPMQMFWITMIFDHGVISTDDSADTGESMDDPFYKRPRSGSLMPFGHYKCVHCNESK